MVSVEHFLWVRLLRRFTNNGLGPDDGPIPLRPFLIFRKKVFLRIIKVIRSAHESWSVFGSWGRHRTLVYLYNGWSATIDKSQQYPNKLPDQYDCSQRELTL